MNVLIDEVGVEKIKSTIVKPLTNIKIADHWGCHILKPSYEVKTDNPEDPKLLDELITITGAQLVEYDEKKTCCGNSANNTDEKLSLQIAQTKLKVCEKLVQTQ
jgi:heterodisulfide reductase subunit B